MKYTILAFGKQFSLVFLVFTSLTALFAMPSMLAIASPHVQQSTDASGVWDITVVDPGGWEMIVEMKQKDAEGSWSDPTPVAVNGPGYSETSFVLNLNMNGDQLTGTYQLEPQLDCDAFGSEGNLMSPELADKWCKVMNSGEVNGSANGDQVVFNIGMIYSLQGKIKGETIQGTGQFDFWKTGKYMNDADIPVTFNAARREGSALVDCQVKISTPENLTPGDDLWVSATFTDPDGKEIIPKSHAYYINGKEATSAKWDGESAQIEVQYTCPNGKMKNEKLTIPAYVEPKPDKKPEEKEKADSGKQPADQGKAPADEKTDPVQEKTEDQNNEKNPGEVDLEKVANIAVTAGGLLTAVSGAMGAGMIIKVLAESTKAPLVAQKPVAATAGSAPHQTKSSQPRSKAGNKRITSAERARLQQRLDTIQTRRVELTGQQDVMRQVQQQVFQNRERMQRIYKRNAIRVILRLGFETQQYLEILYNPGRGAVQLVNQLTQEAVGRAVEAPPQGANDAQILENQRQSIRRLNDELQRIRQQRYEIHLQEENLLREAEEIRDQMNNPAK